MAKFRIEFYGIAHVEADDYETAVDKFFDNECDVIGTNNSTITMTKEVDKFDEGDFERLNYCPWDGVT